MIIDRRAGGGHQADESLAAAQERADHQRDPRHEGKQAPQCGQLSGQLSGGRGALGRHGVPGGRWVVREKLKKIRELKSYYSFYYP